MDLNKALLFLGGLSTVGIGTVANADSIQYNVESGDTLSKIALNHNVDVDKIVNDNNIDDPNRIYVGDVLTINTDSQNEVSNVQDFVDSYNVNEQTEPVSYNVESNVDYSDYYTQVQSENYQTYQNTQDVSNTTPVVSQESVVPAYNDGNAAAKEWIAQRESGGSYDARNGRYVGRYQLTDAYLGGDYSPENQERVADQYVSNRYGSWQAAKDFWVTNGWY